jgi:hypothetical protein
MFNAEFLLRFFLRWVGFVAMLAIIAVVMPFSWMDAIHRQLGMGPLPDQPIVGYLARSLSAFYALFGALLWRLSLDVRGNRPLIRFIGMVTVVFGVTLLGIDIAEKMPGFWRNGEGPITIVLGSLLIVAVGRIKDPPSNGQTTASGGCR